MAKRVREYAQRRLDMVQYLSRIRVTHYRDLMERYNISAPTLNTDLLFLETEYYIPLVRERGATGCIKVMDGWYADKMYLTDAQLSVIKSLIAGKAADETDKEILQTILDDFAPKNKNDTEKDL